MTLKLTPELGIPFAKDTGAAALRGYRAKAEALINTLNFLREAEALPPEALASSEDDLDRARSAFTQEKISPLNQTPASVQHLEALLTQYDHELVDVSVRLRAYVTNRLIEESDNVDSRIRLRALELLGKLTDVGLFSERVEVVQRTMTAEEIEKELQDRFDKMMARTVVSTQENSHVPDTITPVLDVDLDEVL